MKKIKLFLLLFVVTIGLIACGTSIDNDGESNSDPAEDSPDEQIDLNGDADESDESETENSTETDSEESDEGDTEQADEQAPDLEEEKEATLHIEGMEEATTLHLNQAADFDFSVYVPADMIGEYDQDHFNVYTNFEDDRNENARLFITAIEQQAVRDELESEGFTLVEPETFAYDFSNEEFQLEKDEFIGRVAFFTENEREYAIGYYYPEEFADGFSARSALIVENIVWHD